MPWEEFRPTLERVWRKPEGMRKSRAGRKPMDAVVMFITLVLGALYNLSEDQIGYQMRDRLSFMRFLGLGLEDRIPDARTVWLCRGGLAQAGMVEALFRQFDGCLARQGQVAARRERGMAEARRRNGFPSVAQSVAHRTRVT